MQWFQLETEHELIIMYAKQLQRVECHNHTCDSIVKPYACHSIYSPVAKKKATEIVERPNRLFSPGSSTRSSLKKKKF